jgi:site-specific DNA-methyltransferase (adenine-specific)
MDKVNYNPDVLTCLANLSNDEVFTPPSVANAVLDMLPKELWKDKNATFFDPVCKSGIFLREIAKRLMIGLEKQIPNQQKRIDHIFTKQLYGIAITELTSLLSRRSVYCSKAADGKYSVCDSFDSNQGNILFERTEHIWQNKQCTYCGASQEVYERSAELETHAYQFIHTDKPDKLLNMKFDVIVGNPPYQLTDSGFGTSAAPIYDKFVLQAKKLNPRYLTMIIPSRWFAGGKGLDEFRESMLADDRIRSIDDYLSASDIFPGVGLKGGICIFLWDRENRGPCSVTTHFNGEILSTATRKLLEDGADVFIRFNEGLSILEKVIAVETGQNQSLLLPESKRFDRMVSSRKPFGLDTMFKGKTKKGAEDDLLIYQNGGTGYVPRNSISSGIEFIDKWKVFTGRAAPGTGNKDTYPHRIISTPFIGEPGTISSETYLCIGPLDSKIQAENVLSYLSCRLTRLLILLHKPSQDTTRKVYTFVPSQDWNKRWTDQDLYTKYDISADEIAFIESMIRPMD